jgi:hypothetical protein
MKIYIPPQVKRLLFFLVIFIAIFIFLRRMLIPDTFGDLGHYRAASIIDNAAKEPVYAGHETCVLCHDDVGEQLSNDVHSGLHCEICHEAGYAHSMDPTPDNIVKPSGREFCGLCHSYSPTRPGDVISQVDLKEHNIESNCIECHNPHQPWEMFQ